MMGKRCAFVYGWMVALGLWLALTGCGGAGNQSSQPAISVTVSPASATVDGSVDASHQNTAPFTAIVVNDSGNTGVRWTTSAGTLSGSTTTSTTLTTPAPTSSAKTVTVTATSIADATKSGTATITVPATPSITNLTTAQQTVNVGAAYSQTLAATGGIGPYTWTLASGSNPLPPCLTLSSSGGLSSLSTPTGTCVAPTVAFSSRSPTRERRML